MLGAAPDAEEPTVAVADPDADVDAEGLTVTDAVVEDEFDADEHPDISSPTPVVKTINSRPERTMRRMPRML